MRGLCFLLLTISFLIMIQIQSGISQNVSGAVTPATTTTKPATRSDTKSDISATSSTSANSAASSSISRFTTPTTTFRVHTIRKNKSGAPALRGLGSGSVLVFLTNTLIQLLHFS